MDSIVFKSQENNMIVDTTTDFATDVESSKDNATEYDENIVLQENIIPKLENTDSVTYIFFHQLGSA